MAITINGTTGIAGVDGSASTPAVQGSDTNTGLSFGTDTVNINTGGTANATVDSAGRLLVGTTTGDPYGNRQLTVASSGTTTALELRSPTNGTGRIYFTDSTASGTGAYMASVQYDHTNNFMKFETNGGTERMRIHSTGCLSLGSSPTQTYWSDTKMYVENTDGNVAAMSHAGSNNNYLLTLRHNRSNGSTGATQIIFLAAGGTGVGSIQSTGSSTSFNTSSDYRLKENVTTISDGITRLKTLKPSRFNFIAVPDKTVDGFLAHEVTAVPEAISGTKDEVVTQSMIDSGDAPRDTKLNDPIYQEIDQAKLVPLLTAALQEAITKIETLETKVAALEAA